MNRDTELFTKEELLNNNIIKHKEVPGFPGYIANINGELFGSSKYRSEIFKKRHPTKLDKYGDLRVSIQRRDNKPVSISLSMIIARTFYFQPYLGQVAVNIDGNKFNNTISNIYLTYPKFNAFYHLYNKEDLLKSKIIHKECELYPGYIVNENAEVFSCVYDKSGNKKYRKLNPTFRKGRPSIAIRVEGKRKTMFSYSILLETFKGLCPEGMECCHNDGDKTNNKITNLRWDTHKNNMADKIKHNTVQNGSKNGNSKLEEKQVEEIIKLIIKGEQNLTEIANIFNVTKTIPLLIKQKKIWRHVWEKIELDGL